MMIWFIDGWSVFSPLNTPLNKLPSCVKTSTPSSRSITIIWIQLVVPYQTIRENLQSIDWYEASEQFWKSLEPRGIFWELAIFRGFVPVTRGIRIQIIQNHHITWLRFVCLIVFLSTNNTRVDKRSVARVFCRWSWKTTTWKWRRTIITLLMLNTLFAP